MGNVAIVTDSNSGISQAEGKELGIYVIPMPFLVDGKLYFEDVDMNKEQFYHFLENDADLSTSQPSPGDVMDLWDKLLKEYDEIVHIPMSSGLSASCSTAMGLARDYDGKVQVVDNQRISVTMQQAVMDAKYLAAAGKSAAQIKEILEKEALESSIYLMVDTLKYLKKGGRITPAAALLGSALNLKPILQIQGDKLDAYKKSPWCQSCQKEHAGSHEKRGGSFQRYDRSCRYGSRSDRSGRPICLLRYHEMGNSAPLPCRYGKLEFIQCRCADSDEI